MRLLAAALTVSLACGAARAALPPPSALPERKIPPDPMDGPRGRVRDAAAWSERRAELLRLFQHYMYGYAAARPRVRATVLTEDRGYLGGAATLRRVRLALGPGRGVATVLTVATPNSERPAPCLFGLSLDESLAAPAIERGFAFATFEKQDLAPDAPDYSRGAYPLYRPSPAARRGPHEWGALAVWSWGLGAAARYLESAPGIDGSRLVAVGHSRMGKAALLAGALYPDIAAVVAHQAGAGGSAPLRVPRGLGIETVADLLDGYPQWFTPAFASFHDHPERLPFSQCALEALMAPRPLLLGTELEARWTNPEGQFRCLRQADEVYRLLRVPGLAGAERPRTRGALVGERLGYYVRRQDGHFLTADDLQRFMDFAERTLGPAKRHVAMVE